MTMRGDGALAALQAAAASVAYGCSRRHVRLQPPSPTVAASVTYGCSLRHLRLQGLMLYGGLALLNARNAYAHTPLHVAVSRGATRAVR